MMNEEDRDKLRNIPYRLKEEYDAVRNYRTLARDHMDESLEDACRDLEAYHPQRALSLLGLLLHEAARAMTDDNPEPKIYAKAISEISKILWPET